MSASYPPSRRQRRGSFSVPTPSQPRSASPPRATPTTPAPRVQQHTAPSPPRAPATPSPSPRTPSSAASSIPGSLPSQASSASRVRWHDNLVCPSPVPKHARRRGWFNRRGDQLWTNQGAYRPAPAGEEYPRDLHHYPDFGAGWMNEEGTRIDMQHRLMPKAPLRSALKRIPTANTV
ncbi:hypothetical protein OF83DRAFT_1059687 [Amylostereum chailletii]|nr:hypothetical protein OF83DRAFT_1059687 [Amylostereum chailletii]